MRIMAQQNNKSSQPVVSVNSVGVKFFLRPEGIRHGVKDWLRRMFSGREKQEFWALRYVSFEVNKGEILGIIGSNGAGKSTLLKAIAGIYPLTEGQIGVNGRLAPLIELGAAFNPDLSGAENIFLTGMIYRVPRREIQDKLDKIVDFSGLRKFINVPVRNYSSGMFIRLAFSIIIFFQPDIILIDEVFSVGDEIFQRRSFEKILSFKKRGATILLVTHDLKLITRICDRALVLSEGKPVYLGEPEEAIRTYQQLIKQGEGLEARVVREEAPAAGISPPISTPEEAKRWGNKQVEIHKVEFVNEQGQASFIFRTGDYFEARIAYISRLKGERPVFGVAISTIYKLLIYGPNTLEIEFPSSIPKEGIIRFIVPKLPLLEGDYLFSASAYDEALQKAYDHHEMMYHFRVVSDGRLDFGSVRMDAEWRVEKIRRERSRRSTQ